MAGNEAVERNNKGIRLAAEGRDAAAEREYIAALDAARSDDLSRAKIANNLAVLYQRQDRYRDAERMFRAALQWRQKKLPATSTEVAYSLNNLAEVYGIQGRHWEARNLMESAARNLQEFHDGAPGLPIVLGNLALELCRFDQLDRATELSRSALSLYRRRGEIRGTGYGFALTTLGLVLVVKNDLEAAAPLYQEAIDIFQRMGAKAGPGLAGALAASGELYRRMQRIEEARQAEQRALDLLPPNGNALLRVQILRSLGNLVATAGNAADSLPYFEQSLVIQERTAGADYPTTAGLLLDYASATERAGKKSLSRKLHKRAMDLLARLGNQSTNQMTVSLRDLRNGK